MNWNQLLTSLDAHINWNQHDTNTSRCLEQIISEFALTPNAIVSTIRELISDETRLDQYMPHMEYPRPFMDKFLLYMDPTDRFRIRLHRFRTLGIRGLDKALPTIHDHRWNYTTFILAGSYKEQIFSEVDVKAECAPQVVSEHIRITNSVNSLAPRILHRTINESSEKVCLSLFIRGRSVLKQNRVWDDTTHAFRMLKGQKEQLTSQLAEISNALANGNELFGTTVGGYS